MRALQVRVVKTKKTEEPTCSCHRFDETLEGKTAIISRTVERCVGPVARAIVTYVVVDTIRKVVIARAKRS